MRLLTTLFFAAFVASLLAFGSSVQAFESLPLRFALFSHGAEICAYDDFGATNKKIECCPTETHDMVVRHHMKSLNHQTQMGIKNLKVTCVKITGTEPLG